MVQAHQAKSRRESDVSLLGSCYYQFTCHTRRKGGHFPTGFCSKKQKETTAFAWCGLTVVRLNVLYSVSQMYITNVTLYYFRWTELTRKIELCVEIHELNEQGEYMPVEVLHRNEVLTGGVFQLRQVRAYSHQTPKHQCWR